MSRRATDFETIRSEGGLLPPDLLRRVLEPKEKLEGTRPEDYGLVAGERLNEVITQSWNRLRRVWVDFRTAAANLPEREAGTGLTNDRWSLPLLRDLGFGVLPTGAGPEIGGRTYAISRFLGPVPVHLVGCGLSLDRRAAGVRGAAAANPHGLVQEFLNRSPGHLWAVVSNGLRLRILRDNQALSRQSFLEFDLEAMFAGEVYSDFVLLWLIAHATRFSPLEAGRPESCWLEGWAQLAGEQGTRALGDLRIGVERALEILGEGFTGHPRNATLRDALRTGRVRPAELHGQLLRVVYRLIFLFVAEDRTLDGTPLLHPRGHSDASRIARERYAAHYSSARLREMAGKIKGSRHGDLWRQFQLVGGALSGEASFAAAREHLALPALGSFLWDPVSTAALNDAELMNHDFLESLRHLAFTRQGKMLRPVDYKNLGAEELGGVYEGLLALTPQVSADGARFSFAEFAGHERKTSGSYYTPDSLVQRLLDSALDPVVEEAIKGKTGAEAERAVLALKVCDPAVGSGHFLVGGAHRLARHLARVRALSQGESEPSPLLYQQALRDVIGRCLYGVDVNPMAAELCRVSLWLEALEPGRPLSFLDHHIRVGNSLLGTTPELIVQGIPDDAFKPIEGDEKQVCAQYRKQNKREREFGDRGLLLQVAEPQAEYATLAARARVIDEVPDDTVDAIRRKADQFHRLVVSREYRHAQQIADAWCAAFVWPKRADAPAEPLTTDTLRRLEADPDALTGDQLAEVDRLSRQYQFFHWHLAFPEVFDEGGFDCVLGNPPWEQTELEEIEWFAARRPDIATSPNDAEKKRLICELRDADPGLHREFGEAKRSYGAFAHFATNSGRFPLCGRGRMNTASLFAELSRDGVGVQGRVGIVVPTGIATDDTTKDFFNDLIRRTHLLSLLGFHNGKALFPAVRPHQQFCLLTLGRNPGGEADYAFSLSEVGDLQDPERRFVLTAADIDLVNPNSHTCPIFASRKRMELTRLVYRRVPVLLREGAASGTPWGVSFKQGLFNMATDSSLFRTQQQLESDGWALRGKIFFRGEDEEYLPLFDPKMAQQFNHRAADLSFSGHQFRKISKDKSSTEQLHDPFFTPSFLYWVPKQEVESSLADWRHRWLIGFKDVTGTTSTNIGVFAAIPLSGVGHKFPLIFAKADASGHALLLASLNNWMTEFVLRSKFHGLSLAFFYLKQLPVLPPSTFGSPCQWSSELLSLRDWLITRVLELTYTAWDLEPFAEDCGWSGPPFRWDEERRFLLRCELDSAFFHLYLAAEANGDWRRAESETAEDLARLKTSFPTPRDAVAYIMDTFSIVRRRDEAKFDGDYRTKRVILEIYDAMQEAMRTGTFYQTGLDPPPGPPTGAGGKFLRWESLTTNPPPHIHPPR